MCLYIISTNAQNTDKYVLIKDLNYNHTYKLNYTKTPVSFIANDTAFIDEYITSIDTNVLQTNNHRTFTLNSIRNFTFKPDSRVDLNKWNKIFILNSLVFIEYSILVSNPSGSWRTTYIIFLPLVFLGIYSPVLLTEYIVQKSYQKKRPKVLLNHYGSWKIIVP